MLGKNTYQHGELLDTLIKPPVPKWPTSVKLCMQHFTVLLLDYGSHKQKDLAVLIYSVKNKLKFNTAVYSTEIDK